MCETRGQKKEKTEADRKSVLQKGLSDPGGVLKVSTSAIKRIKSSKYINASSPLLLTSARQSAANVYVRKALWDSRALWTQGSRRTERTIAHDLRRGGNTPSNASHCREKQSRLVRGKSWLASVVLNSPHHVLKEPRATDGMV